MRNQLEGKERLVESCTFPKSPDGEASHSTPQWPDRRVHWQAMHISVTSDKMDLET